MIASFQQIDNSIQEEVESNEDDESDYEFDSNMDEDKDVKGEDNRHVNLKVLITFVYTYKYQNFDYMSIIFLISILFIRENGLRCHVLMNARN